MAHDQLSPDFFWLKDDGLEDNASLPAPEVIAAEIMENLRAAVLTSDAVNYGHEQWRGKLAVDTVLKVKRFQPIWSRNQDQKVARI